MKKYLLSGISLILAIIVRGQAPAVLTLEWCQQKAVDNYPAYRQYELLTNSSELNIKNLNKNYLPELNINAQASYQSDVTKVPTIIPEFAPEPISKDWYKLTLDLNQVIYDGGTTRQNKNLESIDHQIDAKNLDIELYQLRDRVSQIYFNILVMQQNQSLLKLHKETIEARLKEMESAVRNGVVLASNAYILRAEILKTEQKQAEIDLAVSAGLSTLSKLVGEDIPASVSLDMTEPDIVAVPDLSQRLEFGLFSLQETKMDALKKVTGTRQIPRLFAFGQAGIGRPAFDMLSNDFQDFYIVGAKLNWNFWNWNKTRNEKKILDIRKEIILTNQETFATNAGIDLDNKISEILKYNELIKKDAEIVSIRSRIMKTYESQLENGVITSTEYLNELNAETEAKLNLELHRVQLVHAKYDYLATAGKL